MPRYERRHGPVKPDDQRKVGAQDRDRILHCSAFRRLAGVTQVVAPQEGHVFHNRLTHSLKVGQVGRRLAEHLLDTQPCEVDKAGGLDPEVVEAAGYAHDLGHPPFGHVTEKALLRLCEEHRLISGYEGNAQSFRIVTKLAVRSETYLGLNLSRATLNAILKYPWVRRVSGNEKRKWGAYAEEQCDFNFARDQLGDGRRTLEAELMNFADDVAYAIHDAEDFYRAGLVPLERLNSGWEDAPGGIVARAMAATKLDEDAVRKAWETAAPFAVDEQYAGNRHQRAMLRDWTSLMTQRFVLNVRLDDGCLMVPQNLRAEIELLKALTWEYVIESPALATQQHGHEQVIEGLFKSYLRATEKRPSALPPRFRQWLENPPDEFFGDLAGEEGKVRIVADIIASMTDIEALRMHRRLGGFSPGSLMDGVSL